MPNLQDILHKLVDFVDLGLEEAGKLHDDITNMDRSDNETDDKSGKETDEKPAAPVDSTVADSPAPSGPEQPTAESGNATPGA